MASVLMSVEDMPDVLRELQCALPIMFVSEACPDAPGVKGTCTALRFRNECVFLTAAHVVDRNDLQTAIYVPLGFAGSEARSRIADSRRPRAIGPDIPVDLAIMRPVMPPEFMDGESSAHTVPPFARLDRASPEALFAIAGYPLDVADRNWVDYDARTIRFGKQVTIGTYDAPSAMKGLHTLKVSTGDTGGPNGFSGGPVFRLLHDPAAGTWTPAFAGIVTNGNRECIHFIDAAYVVDSLRATATSS